MRTKNLSFKADTVSDEGYLEAIFSTFGIVDSDGDVIDKSAIQNGKEIALCWSHKWDQPIGKGVIQTDENKATFKGNFFLTTERGREAYETVKAMGSLQEYSWGFKVLEEEKVEKDGKTVNLITKTDEYEISPVLKGANPMTETVEIKTREKVYLDVEINGSYEQLMCDLNMAFNEKQSEGQSYPAYTSVVATFSDHFTAMIYSWDDMEPTYWDVKYTLADGVVTLGDMNQVEASTEFVPVSMPESGKALNIEKHSDCLRVAVTEYVRRLKDGSSIRRESGKELSDQRRKIMVDMAQYMQDTTAKMRDLLDTPVSTSELDSVYLEFIMQGIEV